MKKNFGKKNLNFFFEKFLGEIFLGEGSEGGDRVSFEGKSWLQVGFIVTGRFL